MSDPIHPLSDLDRLAPDVDLATASEAFRTARTRPRTFRHLGMVVAAAVVLVVLGLAGTLLVAEGDVPLATGGEDTESEPLGPVDSDVQGPVGFTVLGVEPTSLPMGTLRAAFDRDEYTEQWRTLGAEEAAPTVDFTEFMVVSITIPDDACPPELERFNRDGDEITPVFVETAPGCDLPLIARTFVVALELTTLPDVFTVVLPGDETYGFSEQRLSIEAGPSPQERQRSMEAHDCPDPGRVPPDDQDPDPPTEVVVLSGDFGDEPWCLSVSESDDLGPCISIRGGAAPEGQQLSSGACDGDLSTLNWHVTGQPEPGFVAYGHAPAEATRVQLFAAGADAVEVQTHSSPEVNNVTFFAVRLPHGFFPDQAAAYAGEEEIERKEAPTADIGD